MSRLVWEGVAAPDFSASLEGIKTAGQFLNNAFASAKGTMTELDENLDERAANAFSMALAKFSNPEELQAALAADPTLGVNAARLDGEAILGARAHVGDLLNQAATGEALTQSRWSNGRTRQLAADSDAARPLLAEAFAKYSQKDYAGGDAILANPAVQKLQMDDLLKAYGAGDTFERNDLDFAGTRQTQEIAGYTHNRQKLTDAQTDLAQQFIAAARQNSLYDTDALEYVNGLKIKDGAVYNAVVTALGLPGLLPSGGAGGGGGGIGGGGAPVPTDAMGMLREFEGFRPGTYWDVNAHRVGYGSDTITTADGQVRKVKAGDKVSRADAERDLARRTNEVQSFAIQRVGNGWNNLTPGAQAAIVSVGYNYGTGSKRLNPLWEAAARGDSNAVARVIQSFAGDNGGVNADRRNREAAAAIQGMSGRDIAALDTASAIGRAHAITGNDDPVISGYFNNADKGGITPAAAAAAASAQKGGVFAGINKGKLLGHIQEVQARAAKAGSPVNATQALAIIEASLVKKGVFGLLKDGIVGGVTGDGSGYFTDANGDSMSIDSDLLGSNIAKLRSGDLDKRAMSLASAQLAGQEMEGAKAAYAKATSDLQQAQMRGLRGPALARYVLAQQAAQAALRAAPEMARERGDIKYPTPAPGQPSAAQSRRRELPKTGLERTLSLVAREVLGPMAGYTPKPAPKPTPKPAPKLAPIVITPGTRVPTLVNPVPKPKPQARPKPKPAPANSGGRNLPSQSAAELLRRFAPR